MGIEEFSEKSQEFLARFINRAHFKLEDQELFGKITEPIRLNNKQYGAYYFKKLTGYHPNKELTEFTIFYTFFVLSPAIDIKQEFLENVEKKAKGEKYNESIIGNYYSGVTPGLVEFDNLMKNLSFILSKEMYKSKNYMFAGHGVTVTKDFDFALLFIELNSVKKFLDFSTDKPDIKLSPII